MPMLKANGGCSGSPCGSHEPHIAAPRLLLGPLGLHRGSIWLPMGSIWLLRRCFGEPLGLHMAAQMLHVAAQKLKMAAHGAPYGCSEAAFGCRGGAFRCTVAVCGSHAADMQYMLRLAGPGWASRILGICPGRGSWAVWGPQQ